MENKHNKRQTGAYYETMAAEYLVAQGHHILQMNYRTSHGEIDIISMDGDTLVFTEIKYRTDSQFGDALEAVNLRKQRRICNVAFYYYNHLPNAAQLNCRFDVIAIYGDGHLTHIKNAFDFM